MNFTFKADPRDERGEREACYTERLGGVLLFSSLAEHGHDYV